MRRLLVAMLLFISINSIGQQKQNKSLSFAVTNHHSAKPFAKFSSLFSSVIHPGFSVGYGFNWRTKDRHDWVQQFHAGYFYHRFVQHTLSLYTDIGYRYKFTNRFHTTAAIGGGYMHALPSVAVLQADSEGNYSNAKGIGRPQLTASFSLDARCLFGLQSARQPAVFFKYQQQLQAPFIKSYVPLLPYNAIALGVTIPLQSK